MAEQVRKLNAKAVLSGLFAVVLAVGLAIPASSAFASPADDAQAEAMGMDAVAEQAIGENYDLSLLVDPTELTLARKISSMSDLIASAARDRAPFRLTHYLEELAADFHGFYSACQVLPSEGRPVAPELSRARLAACDAVRKVLALNLRLIGVSAPEKM